MYTCSSTHPHLPFSITTSLSLPHTPHSHHTSQPLHTQHPPSPHTTHSLPPPHTTHSLPPHTTHSLLPLPLSLYVIGLDSAAPPVTVALIHQCLMHWSDCTASMQKALVACGLHHYILKCLAFYKEAEFDEVIIIINSLKSFPCQFIADVLCMVYLYYTAWVGERDCIVFISCRLLGASANCGS